MIIGARKGRGTGSPVRHRVRTDVPFTLERQLNPTPLSSWLWTVGGNLERTQITRRTQRTCKLCVFVRLALWGSGKSGSSYFICTARMCLLWFCKLIFTCFSTLIIARYMGGFKTEVLGKQWQWDLWLSNWRPFEFGPGPYSKLYKKETLTEFFKVMYAGQQSVK